MIPTILFYLFAAVLIASATMVVSARNPVHSVLFLILSFFNAAALFLIAGAEFLAMTLVIVYVGAVAVLFLFVVMMLDIDFEQLRSGFQRYLPVGGLVGLVDRLDRGDLVALRDPSGAGSIVKRVVGLPGDVVEIQDAVLLVGGAPVAEPYADLSGIDGVFYGPVTVPAGSVLVLGDDRGRSVDSRDFGPVPVSGVTGRVLLRLWPWWR